MFEQLSFGKRVAAGFALVTVLTIGVGVGGIVALESVSDAKDSVLEREARNMIRVETLRGTIERKTAAFRSYLLVRDNQTQAIEEARQEIYALMAELLKATPDAEGQRLLSEIRRIEDLHHEAFVRISKELTDQANAGLKFSEELQPVMRDLRIAITAFRDHQEASLAASTAASAAEVALTETWLVVLVGLTLLLAIVAAFVLTRVISRQIGQAITRVHSSAAELQTAASQQASSTKEQSSAMSEITTTINELLVTSRQIAESAQRVAQIADATTRSTRSGEEAMGRSTESMATIKRQVDLIVHQMLDLGRKSQHIGGILDIINELAEQTNILSINATIEAAGAGEHGRRFAVVADEIRRLADRVGGSTREIRGLIDEVRAAVNTAVMTTEGGTKAVDAGVRQFDDVTQALRDIVQSAGTTTEAAREIELSTKQQATAVSQVNLAISSVAQATREAEASATQTYQTAAELSALARDLSRLIWARENARPGQGTV